MIYKDQKLVVVKGPGIDAHGQKIDLGVDIRGPDIQRPKIWVDDKGSKKDLGVDIRRPRIPGIGVDIQGPKIGGDSKGKQLINSHLCDLL